MVANYRCNEIKDEASALVKQKIEALSAQSDAGIVQNFNETCSSIMKEASNYFRSTAKQYN